MSLGINQKFLGLAELFNVPVGSGKKATHPFQHCRVVIQQADCSGRIKQSGSIIDSLPLGAKLDLSLIPGYGCNGRFLSQMH